LKDVECVRLLQWALPRLGLRWAGFRKVRRQVCKRVDRRLAELGLPDGDAYREYLEANDAEWTRLDALCRIPISRFCRDRAVFERLGSEVLPRLAAACAERGESALRSWSAGCASGEEPYSLKLVWALGPASRFPGIALQVIASDVDVHLLERARQPRYGASSLRNLAPEQVEYGFERINDGYRLRPALRHGVELRCEDIRSAGPQAPFDLVLCRNLAFTYFDDAVQRETLHRLVERLRPGGFLVIGIHASLPEESPGLIPWDARCGFYRRG
jgi:chemotaxis protein methyltransferase CheR